MTRVRYQRPRSKARRYSRSNDSIYHRVPRLTLASVLSRPYPWRVNSLSLRWQTLRSSLTCPSAVCLPVGSWWSFSPTPLPALLKTSEHSAPARREPAAAESLCTTRDLSSTGSSPGSCAREAISPPETVLVANRSMDLSSPTRTSSTSTLARESYPWQTQVPEPMDHSFSSVQPRPRGLMVSTWCLGRWLKGWMWWKPLRRSDLRLDPPPRLLWSVTAGSLVEWLMWSMSLDLYFVMLGFGAFYLFFFHLFLKGMQWFRIACSVKRGKERLYLNKLGFVTYLPSCYAMIWTFYHSKKCFYPLFGCRWKRRKSHSFLRRAPFSLTSMSFLSNFCLDPNHMPPISNVDIRRQYTI